MEMKGALAVALLSVISLISQVNCQEAILHISNGSLVREYCIVHNHSWTPLPETLDTATAFPLANWTSTVLCNASGVLPDVVKGKAMAVMRGDCDFSQKALVAQSLGATALLIVSNTTLITPSANESEYAKVHIPLALMRYRDFLTAKQVFGEGMQAKLFAPPYSKIDPNIAVMLLISIVTVALGGYWSGACERRMLGGGANLRTGGGSGKNSGSRCPGSWRARREVRAAPENPGIQNSGWNQGVVGKALRPRSEDQLERNGRIPGGDTRRIEELEDGRRSTRRERFNSYSAGGGGGGGGEDSKADSNRVFLYSPLNVVIFVILMCGMLVLMYFFYNVVVYIMIAIFCLASASALFSCLDAVLDKIGCGTLSFSVQNKSFSVRSILLAALCISVAVVWGVYRNEDRWIWILQNLLGFAFCLNFMKTITLSNFKICVILLSLLLLYDVFFVFITPFFTKNGVSIMVQVALGPDATGEKTQGNMVEIPAEPQAPSEKIPVVMRLPRFSAWAQNLCGMQFSILGYGDIIVPGLLVAYCSRFDVWINSRRKVYFISCCFAYLLGMVLTFAVMLLSGMGQPALLYLVPFTLITSAVVAGCRGEMRQFWTGTTYEVLDSPREPLLPEGRTDRAVGESC